MAKCSPLYLYLHWDWRGELQFLLTICHDSGHPETITGWSGRECKWTEKDTQICLLIIIVQHLKLMHNESYSSGRFISLEIFYIFHNVSKSHERTKTSNKWILDPNKYCLCCLMKPIPLCIVVEWHVPFFTMKVGSVVYFYLIPHTTSQCGKYSLELLKCTVPNKCSIYCCLNNIN